MPPESPEPRGPEIALYRTRRRPWAPFDERTRGAWIEAIRNGLSKSAACAALQVSPSVVHRWLTLGGCQDSEEYAAAGGKGYMSMKWSEKRLFWLHYQSALAYAGNLTSEVMIKAALGYVFEEDVYDENGRQILNPDGTPKTVKQRIRGDWRAADALNKQREREAVSPDDRRLRKAQADKEEALARAAQSLEMKARAEAERSAYMAELAKRQVTKVQGAVYFPATFIAAIEHKRPELHAELVKAMAEEGYTTATEEDAQRMAEQRDPKKDAEAEALFELWSLAEGQEPPEDVS